MGNFHPKTHPVGLKTDFDLLLVRALSKIFENNFDQYTSFVFWKFWLYLLIRTGGEMPKCFATVGFLLIFLLITPNVYALADSTFDLLYQKDGVAGSDYFGVSVSSAGDINGDGRADFIVGACFADPDGHPNAGSAFVYSGVDGSLLYQKNGAAAGDYFGYSVASAGDVNGDGRGDFIIGAFYASPGGLINAGSAFVYSGADGSLLYEKNGAATGHNFGYSVTGNGDIDGDGKDDFIIGTPLADSSGQASVGSAYVYSGATGDLLYQKYGAEALDYLGFSVGSVGDVNEDDRDDFIVGAYNASPNELTNAGSAFVYSGIDGSLLYQKNGAAPSDNLGVSVASSGDVNGDGKADFIIGAWGADSGGYTNAGVAYVYSGADGSLLYEKYGNSTSLNFGRCVSSAGDVNGDGNADFIVATNIASPGGGLDNAGSVFVYSGSDGSLLTRINGMAAGDQMGWSVGSAGDVNADGRTDFIIGAHLTTRLEYSDTLYEVGSAYVMGFQCPAKGDLNGDGTLTPSDVILMLNCVFLNTGICGLCFADVSCNGLLTTSDVVIELNAVFLTEPIICQP